MRDKGAILTGMLLAVGSLFFTWQMQAQEIPLALRAAALHTDPTGGTVSLNGFGAGVASPITICAVLAGGTLLWEMTSRNRYALMIVAGAGGFACLVIPLARFAMLPGPIVCLSAASLLLFGIWERGKKILGDKSL